MANGNQPIDPIIAQLLQLTQQQGRQPVTLNTGLLAPGQEGIQDVFTNPDQAQINALVGGISGLVNPRGGQPGLTALANAAQQFGGTRQSEFQSRLAQRKLESQELQSRIQNAIGVAGLSQRIRGGNLAERQFDVDQLRLRDVATAPGGIIGTDNKGDRVFKPNPLLTSAEHELLQDRKAEDIKSRLEASDTEFSRANILRDEITAASKDFTIIGNSFARIEAVANDPSPAGDLALIFNFMKMLDPNSVVRESEFANAQNTGSVPDNVWNAYNRVLNGQKLGETRDDFLNQARNLFESQKVRNTAAVETIIDIGEQTGVRRSLLVGRQTADQIQEIKDLLRNL